MSFYWVYLRCCAKVVRHLYNAYLALNLKFEYFWVDWLRMTSFYVLYVAEYFLGVALIIAVLPKVRGTGYTLPNEFNVHIDLSLLYVLVISVSVPNFVSTFVYLHKKRA